MRIRLTIPRSGVQRSYRIGDEVEWPDAEAQRLIARGEAVPVRSADVETATLAAPAEDPVVETASARPTRSGTGTRRGRPRTTGSTTGRTRATPASQKD